MTEIKRIDINEFQRAGFLQEANRLFFHPHGLALEVTRVDKAGWKKEDSERVVKLAHALAEDAGGDRYENWIEEAQRIMNLVFPPGSAHLSGVWDYRDDPEGVIFGGDIGHNDEKATRVAEERARHYEARAKMFGGEFDPLDVEPLGFVYEEEEEES